jgi:hypothetical protein
MIKSRVDYKQVFPGTHEFLELQAFARTFGHEIVEHPRINVFAHYRDGVLFGYSDHVYIPTVYPAYHPEFTKPQDVIQVMRDFRILSQINGTPGYMGVPLVDGRPNFPDDVMTKLGFTRCNRELFSITPAKITEN